MTVIRGVIAGILLFLGRELNFLFAAAMAALIGLRLTPLLPPQWPGWTDYAFMGALAIIAAAITITNERVGYFLSGFPAPAIYRWGSDWIDHYRYLHGMGFDGRLVPDRGVLCHKPVHTIPHR